MTAQVPDTFIHEGERYDLVGLSGEGLFSPEALGLQPVMMHTACYRGYYCTYTVTAEGLFLSELAVRTADGTYPPIDGVAPQLDEYGIQAGYSGLHLPVAFTGTLLLAKDFIRELYVHMGFQKPSAYETVLEFRFESGRPVSERDISAQVAQRRGAFHDRFGRGNLMQDIDDAFSLDPDVEE